MLSLARDDVIKYGGIASFNPTEVLVVTWYEVKPNGASSQAGNQLNTYQLVLMSDGLKQRTFALYLYGAMAWDQATGWGNQVGWYSQRNFVVNTYNSPFAGSGQAFNLQNIPGNTGMSSCLFIWDYLSMTFDFKFVFKGCVC